ncbi:AAA family ATPase [Microbacterium proteolyticum]|uniref:AAA family ATPase n=1 Tax=Microbacterium proteolyticum TaxID=1572644 RepID=UPI001FACD6EE|nr:SMC family ATPase [Microbacterium proteolyticum]MCI9858798.1 SMC family ATPase [Microbacterium proteolyticum]
MKLHRLELEGFGPFLDAQEVDFDAFADDGIFLITGRTGAGKSSVLDGVCYALYGGVPRYDGAERRLRSDHCGPDDPTRVTLEFSTEGERWRVTRSPEFERPKRRGGGTTREPHRALLEVLAPEGWTGVAARPVDVAARLDEILGLTQQQFLQVILLAQNRFARFLLAKNDERLTLLRTLFGTRSFEQYAADLDERRKRASERLAAEGVEVATLLDEAERLVSELDDREHDGPIPGDDAGIVRGVSERLALVVRAVERADYRVDTLARENQVVDARLDAALVAEREARSRAERQRDRLGERERLAVLEAGAEAIAAIRREAEAAAGAEELRPAIETAEAARRTCALADERLADADAGVLAVDEVLADDADLGSRDDALTALLARGEAALKVERELADLERDTNRLRGRVETVDAERQKLAVERLEIPDMLRALDDRIAELAGADARRDAALALRDETSRRLDAAREAARLLDQRDQADLASLVRADDLQRAIDAWTTLLRRRLSGAAVELAHELVDGEPCAVCGAREHPHPARGSDAPVSDADLAAAEDRKNVAVESDRLASDAARVARDAHALAAALAGGESVEVLRARLATADDALLAAAADVVEYDRVRGDRTRAADLDASIARRLDALGAELAVARQDLALAQQRTEALGGEVASARGGFDTVAARQDDLRTRRDAVRRLISARAAVAAAHDARRDADSVLAALVADSDFAEVTSVTAALRSGAHRRSLDTAAAEYDAALAATRQRLFDLELMLVDAGDEPIEFAPFVAEVASAREAVQLIAAAGAGARALAERLRSLAERADAGHAAVASLADEYAVVARLADTVAGRAPNTRRMTLETFVLAAELEEIVTAANLRLEHMSAGRYRLQHTDALAARGASSGLGLEIMDAFTGQCRPPQSLSGGETFLTSLALALGLAEVVTARAGGLRLDTLFIDEGFGSLDDDTLDLAMRTLDELRQGGRTVGVISHVASMRDQLPAQLHVTATPRGPSVIRHDVVLARG